MKPMPDVADWQLLGENDEANQSVIDALNIVLNEVLAAAKIGGYSMFQLAD